MKRFFIPLLAFCLAAPASAQTIDLQEDTDNAQFNALLERLKLGKCQSESYSAFFDAGDSFAPWDLTAKENREYNTNFYEDLKQVMESEGRQVSLERTVEDSPISYISIVNIDGERMADRYVYLSGYEFNEYCWLEEQAK